MFIIELYYMGYKTSDITPEDLFSQFLAKEAIVRTCEESQLKFPSVLERLDECLAAKEGAEALKMFQAVPLKFEGDWNNYQRRLVSDPLLNSQQK